MSSKFQFVLFLVFILSSLNAFQVFNNGKAYIEKSDYQKKVLDLKKKFLKGNDLELVSKEVDKLLANSSNTELDIFINRYKNTDNISKYIQLPSGTSKVSLDIVGLNDTDKIIVDSKKNILDQESNKVDTFNKDGTYKLSSYIPTHIKALGITYIQNDQSKANDVKVDFTFYKKVYKDSLIRHYLYGSILLYQNNNQNHIDHKFLSTDHGSWTVRYSTCHYSYWQRFPSWNWGWNFFEGLYSYFVWVWRLVTRTFSCISTIWQSQFGYSNNINKDHNYIGVKEYRYVVELYGITDDSDDFISINGEKYSGNLYGKKLYFEDHEALNIEFYTDHTGWTNDIPGIRVSREKITYEEIK